jgi:hypothetical protein
MTIREEYKQITENFCRQSGILLRSLKKCKHKMSAEKIIGNLEAIEMCINDNEEFEFRYCPSYKEYVSRGGLLSNKALDSISKGKEYYYSNWKL